MSRVILFFLLFKVNYVFGNSVFSQSADTLIYHYHAEATPSMFDEILVLVKTDNGTKCMYYGPSIEFDDSPEPFLPGFIMLEATNFIMDEGNISFKLNSTGRGYYSQPVELRFREDEDIISSGYKLWIQAPEFFWREVTFEGIYDNSTISIFNKTLRPKEMKVFYRESLRETMNSYKRDLIDAELEKENSAE